jgi:hypothetical protein
MGEFGVRKGKWIVSDFLSFELNGERSFKIRKFP